MAKFLPFQMEKAFHMIDKTSLDSAINKASAYQQLTPHLRQDSKQRPEYVMEPNFLE